MLVPLLAAAACSESSNTDAHSGNDAGAGGNAGSSSTLGGSGGSSTTDGGEAGDQGDGGTTSTGGASASGGGTSGVSGGAAGASSGGRGGNAGATPGGGASGDAGTGGTPEECVGASSVEGDVVVSVGVETEDLIRSISGNLTIYASVTELRQLRCLEAIGGNLRVTVGSGADNLEALARLRSVGGDVIIEDTRYTDLAGLRSLKAFPLRLTIEGNTKLVALTGLEGFTGVSILEINANPELSNIEALSNMTGDASDIYITMNDALESLAGLGGFSGVTTNLAITDNASLRDLSGLDGIESVDGGLYIRNNPLVSTCEAQEFAARCEPAGGSVIDGNAPCN